MTSEPKTAANRANSRRSTGPRTRAGKKSASRNALRHGLAEHLRGDQAISAEIERLALELAGENPDPSRLELARSAAEAEIDLVRVRNARAALINLAVIAPGAAGSSSAVGRKDQPATLDTERVGDLLRKDPVDGDHDREARGVLRVLPELARFDRYERRALSRRKRVIGWLLRDANYSATSTSR